MSPLSPALNQLQTVLREVQATAKPYAAAPFETPLYTPGVHRFDSTRFFRNPDYPDLVLIENWQKITDPRNVFYRPDADDPQSITLETKHSYPRPRFLISTDRKAYTVFDEWQELGRPYETESVRLFGRLGRGNPEDPPSLPPAFFNGILTEFQSVFCKNGVFLLNPDQSLTSARLYLRISEDGTRARLQIGKRHSTAFHFHLVAGWPRMDDLLANDPVYRDPDSHRILSTIMEIDDGNILERTVHDRFFAGARFYVRSESSLQPDTTVDDLKNIMAELDKLVGLESVKEQIRDYAHYQNWVRLREERNLPPTKKLKLHAVFMGNPGTGKTTVAELLGKIYKRLGLVSRGHVHKVDRSDLVAKYIGQTAPKTREAINKARGGILFVDEAYALAGRGHNDFGAEALEILIQEMSDGPGDIAIIFAGYPKEMEIFLSSNPGLRSRLNLYEFPDYSVAELMEIARRECQKSALTLTDAAWDFLKEQLTSAYSHRDRSFGNARLVCDNLLPKAHQHLARRLFGHPDPDLLDDQTISTITVKDLEYAFDKIKTEPTGARRVVTGFGR